MLVASQVNIPATPLRRLEPLLLPQAGLCPSPEHFMALIPTSWGTCAAIWKHQDSPGPAAPFAARPAGALLCRLLLPGLAIDEIRRQLLGNYPLCDEVFGDGHGNFHPEVVPEWFPELVQVLQSYYANTLRHPATPSAAWTYWINRLDWSPLTAFQRQVLTLVANIQRGSRLTYGQVAKYLGKPNASRAVGAALAKNPWPVLIPCHRVIGASGRMTGFSAPGGIAAKQRMLAMESRIPPTDH